MEKTIKTRITMVSDSLIANMRTLRESGVSLLGISQKCGVTVYTALKYTKGVKIHGRIYGSTKRAREGGLESAKSSCKNNGYNP